MFAFAFRSLDHPFSHTFIPAHKYDFMSALDSNPRDANGIKHVHVRDSRDVLIRERKKANAGMNNFYIGNSWDLYCLANRRNMDMMTTKRKVKMKKANRT